MKIFVALSFLFANSMAFAAGGVGYPLEDITPNYKDKASLQRGLATFSHYCMGCMVG